MLTPDILRELLELLTPLATGGSGIFGLHTQVVLAFGTHTDLLGKIIVGGNAQEYITGLLKTLDEYGETSPGTRALWQFMSHLKTQVGVDKQSRIDVLKPILNSPPLPTIHTASSTPHVFISYARSDGEGFAQALRASLERAMIPLWQDRVGMEGGRDWWAQITAALDKVQFMILIMTPNAMRSDVVRKEWRYARQQGVCVYPVKGAPDLHFASLPKWMRDSHFYDLGFDLDHFEQGAEWGKFLVDLQSECKTPRVPFMAEDMPSDYVPRPEEFEALKGKLLGQDGTDPVAITAALKGAGGYGKTTLAKALCHDEDIQTAFDDGILWVTLGEKGDNLYEKVDDLIYALTGAKSSAPTLETATTKLVELLADRDVLLVIDDVWDQAHLRPFLQGRKGCARLITTRNSDTLPPHVEEQTVDAMKPGEASRLLAAGIHVNDAALQRAFLSFARALGEWALLLKLANGVIRERIKRGETSTQALEYARRTYEKRGVLGFDGRSPSERNQAAQLSLGISFDLLHEDEKRRFAELAIFPEDLNIPLVTLERLWAAAGLDDLDTERLCETLYRYSLLLNFDLKARTIRLHDVVRKYLRDTHQGEIAGWNGRFLDAYGVKAWADLPREEPYLWDQVAYHLTEAGRREYLRKVLLDSHYLQAKLNATAPNALIADCDLYLKGSTDEAIRLVRSAFSMSAHVLGEDKTALAHQLVGRLMGHRKSNFEIRHLTDEIMANVAGIYPVYPDNKDATHDRAGGALIRTLVGLTAPVTYVAVTADTQCAVSVSDDDTIEIWHLPSGTLRSILKGHTRDVGHVALTSDGQYAVSASSDRTLKVWHLPTGTLRHTLKGHTASVTHVALSVDGQYAISVSWDKTLKVWHLPSGTLRQTLVGHTRPVWYVALTLDGLYAVSASSDRTLKVWHLPSGTLRHTLEGHTDSVNTVAVTADGQYVVSISWDNTLKVWHLPSGALHNTLEGHTKEVTNLVVSADGQYVVSVSGGDSSQDHTLKVWHLPSGTLRHTLEGHTAPVTDVTVTADGQYAISASRDKTLKVWHIPTGTLRHTLEGHIHGVTHVAISADDQYVVSASIDHTLKIWHLLGGGMRDTLEGHADAVNQIAVTADGQYAISASRDKTLKVWHIPTGTLRSTLNGHTASVNGVAVTADGQYIISASEDKTLKVWYLPTGSLRDTLKGHTDLVSDVALTADGQYIISASEDKTLKVWYLPTGDLRSTLNGHTASVNGVAVTADGQYIISASEDKTLKVWYLSTGTLRDTLKGHTASVHGVAVTADGQYIISASEDRTLKVWNITLGDLLGSFMVSEQGDVEDELLRAFPMISELFRQSINGWNLFWQDTTLTLLGAQGEVMARFYGDAKIAAAEWTPNGQIIVAGDDAGRVLFLRWVSGN